jgi:predicted kinase
MKTFILLSAVPGAGKSTWAEQYRLTHKHVYVVSSDDIRKEVSGSYQNFEHEKEVWDLFFNRILEYRDNNEDATVIADSTNIENKYRLLYAQKVSGFDRKVLVVLKKPLEVILRQNKERNESKIVPENILLAMYKTYEEPSDEVINYFDEYMVIYKWFDSSKVKESFHYKA